MARLSRPGWLWLNTKMVYRRTVTHPSTNRARRRATTLIETNALPVSQTATIIGIVKPGPSRKSWLRQCLKAHTSYTVLYCLNILVVLFPHTCFEKVGYGTVAHITQCPHSKKCNTPASCIALERCICLSIRLQVEDQQQPYTKHHRKDHLVISFYDE